MCSPNSTAGVAGHDFLTELLRWCEGSSANGNGAALIMNVCLDFEADGEYEPSFCVDFCVQKRVRQTEKCWVP